MTETILFWVLALVSVVGALGVVAAPKAVYSAISLATTMIALAVLYIARMRRSSGWCRSSCTRVQ